MKEIALHILDLVQNSIHAHAQQVEIEITEDIPGNKLEIKITDDGDGLNQGSIKQIQDPFFTTKNKKTGLGIPLFKQHAEMTGGSFHIKSETGSGTTIQAVFEHNHIDRQPFGNMASTLTGLIRTNPDIRFLYKHKNGNKVFELDTHEITKELDGLEITNREIICFLEHMIKENLLEISSG
jgi:anti-sigma regulatory factor (Ser/Thr protein kinase)